MLRFNKRVPTRERARPKGTGRVTAYRDGRGTIELADGSVVSFMWHEVAYQTDALRHRCNSNVGDGRCVKVGDHVEYDGGNMQTPVTITAEA